MELVKSQNSWKLEREPNPLTDTMILTDNRHPRSIKNKRLKNIKCKISNIKSKVCLNKSCLNSIVLKYTRNH